eukprot:1123546-Rhodomonas_salina.5
MRQTGGTFLGTGRQSRPGLPDHYHDPLTVEATSGVTPTDCLRQVQVPNTPLSHEGGHPVCSNCSCVGYYDWLVAARQ